MSTYHLTTRWLVKGTCEEVYRLIEDTDRLAEWWPSVYLATKVLKKGEAGGVGKEVALFTKGWLPYTLIWQLKVTETNFPFGSSIQASGDFIGRGQWRFRQLDDDRCEVIYDWQISANKPLLKRLSWLFRPVFSANHHWAMRKGEKSLKLELLRRQAATPEERAKIPKPPGPTFPHNVFRPKAPF